MRNTSGGLLASSRAMHVHPAATRIELPMFRDTGGASRLAIVPPEVRGPIGDIVLDALIDRGLAKGRVAVNLDLHAVDEGFLGLGTVRKGFQIAGYPTCG